MAEKRGSTSFADLMINAFKSDSDNMNLGRLSSFDFVDYVLKKGPYDPKWNTSPKDKSTYGEDAWKSRLREGYAPAIPPDSFLAETKLNESNLEAKICADCCSNPVQRDINRIERLAKILNEIAQQAQGRDLDSLKVDGMNPEICVVPGEELDLRFAPIGIVTPSPLLEPLLTLPNHVALDAPVPTQTSTTSATVWHYQLNANVELRLAENLRSSPVPLFRAHEFRSANWIHPLDVESEMRLFTFSGSIDPSAAGSFNLRGDLRLSTRYAPAFFSHINIDVQKNVADCFERDSE